jgi:hypothetical protein
MRNAGLIQNEALRKLRDWELAELWIMYRSGPPVYRVKKWEEICNEKPHFYTSSCSCEKCTNVKRFFDRFY